MYKEKLRELLKQVPEVKEAMERLEFGCIVEIPGEVVRIDSNIKYDGKKYIVGNDEGRHWYEPIIEIIGLPLQERFIKMYCRNKKLGIKFFGKYIHIGENYLGRFITIEIDLNKDFNQQDDEVYQKIHEALLKLNK